MFEELHLIVLPNELSKVTQILDCLPIFILIYVFESVHH